MSEVILVGGEGRFIGRLVSVLLDGVPIDGPFDDPPVIPWPALPLQATFSLEYKGTKVKRGKGKKAHW